MGYKRLLAVISLLSICLVLYGVEQMKTMLKGDHPVEKWLDRQAPYLKLRDAHGNRVELSSLSGKVVFINFWATWCPPCIKEMPSIRRLHKKYKENKDFVVLLVDVDGNFKLSQAFLKLRGIDLPVYVAESEIPPEFLPAGVPTSLLIDRANFVAARQIGGANYTSPEIIARIEDLLAEEI